MSFLAPLFLLGALAVAAPLIFHLIRRTTREVTPFSTLMFLQPTPPRVTRRSRLENLWLLFLRCLVIALLAAGFSRPFMRQSATSAPHNPGIGKRTVLLLDTSASMRREELWSAARAKAAELLRNARPVDEFALLAFDRTTRSILSFDDWKSLAAGERATVAGQRLAAISPGWAGTQLDAALLRAVELIEEPGDDLPLQREIVVISDLQEGARLDSLQGHEWPAGLEVVLEPVVAQRIENASVQWLAETEEAASAEAPLRVRVASTAEAKREQYRLTWENDVAATPLDIYVPAGQSRILSAPKPPAGAPRPLLLTGDETPFDNRLYILPPVAAEVPLLFIGADAANDPRGLLYYVQRAFPKTPRQSVTITAHREPQAPPAFQLNAAQLLVLGDGASEAAIAAARHFASEGRIVAAPLTSAAGAAAVARLLEIPSLAATEAAVKDYALLAQIDFQHPLFAPFADPRFSDFTKIHFWKYRRIDEAALPNAQVLARFDNRDPAIVQAPLGKGSVIIFTSSWRPADSQLALSSKFVPLLHAVLDQSSNAPVQKAQYFVGDEVALPAGEQAFTIRKPDGSEAAVEPGGRFTATDEPGIYSIEPGTAKFVVNLAPEESRTSPLPVERFTSLGVPMSRVAAVPAQVAAERKAHLQATEIENRQKLWRWLIVGALGILLLETLIAGRLSRTVAPTPAQT